MRNPKNLGFWDEITEFIVRCYRLTGQLPKDECYNLSSQLKRAAVSVRLNVVEGAACENPAEFARFLEIAYRSLRESITCIELTAELGMYTCEKVGELVDFGDRLAGVIYRYRQSLIRGS
ncbi:MAG: four helix bundle protein [Gemmataceae bacterium]|nr:four helix bundle protein [Gemmataceae bacterium]